MMASRIDLGNEAARAKIEAFQLMLSLDLLRGRQQRRDRVGTWAREKRDALRDAARSIGATVELRYLSADTDESTPADRRPRPQGRWGSRSIRRRELDEWVRIYQPPTDDELANDDPPGHTST